MNLFRVFSSVTLVSLSSAVWAGSPVNVNTASVEQLSMALDGVGQTKAMAIVSWREDNGPFTNPEQLVQVPGIGPGTLERNLEFIQIEIVPEVAQ